MIRFPVFTTVVYLIINRRFDEFSKTIAQTDRYNLKIIYSLKCLILGHITNFGSFRVKFQNQRKVCQLKSSSLEVQIAMVKFQSFSKPGK